MLDLCRSALRWCKAPSLGISLVVSWVSNQCITIASINSAFLHLQGVRETNCLPGTNSNNAPSLLIYTAFWGWSAVNNGVVSLGNRWGSLVTMRNLFQCKWKRLNPVQCEGGSKIFLPCFHFIVYRMSEDKRFKSGISCRGCVTDCYIAPYYGERLGSASVKLLCLHCSPVP